jgi:hypothetical protein
MRGWLRVGGFALAVAAGFALAFGAGRVIGPLDLADADAPAAEHDTEHSPDESERISVTPVAETHRLVLDDAVIDGTRTDLGFRVLDDDGAPVTSYDVAHDKELHLIAVRRDLSDYRHIHPTLDRATGRWTVPVRLSAGDWRVYADFVPAGGEPALVEADLRVAGDYRPEPLGADTTHDRVDDYDVHLERDAATSELTLSVSRDGAPVTDLQPYLGAHGHLVAIRAGDLEYLHVHAEESGSGPDLGFHAEFPTDGRYRLFLDFKHGDVVRTAAFTVTVGGPAGESGEEGGHGDGDGSHGH